MSLIHRQWETFQFFHSSQSYALLVEIGGAAMMSSGMTSLGIARSSAGAVFGLQLPRYAMRERSLVVLHVCWSGTKLLIALDDLQGVNRYHHSHINLLISSSLSSCTKHICR